MTNPDTWGVLNNWLEGLQGFPNGRTFPRTKSHKIYAVLEDKDHAISRLDKP